MFFRYFRPRVNSENHFRRMTLCEEGGTIFALLAFSPPPVLQVEGMNCVVCDYTITGSCDIMSGHHFIYIYINARENILPRNGE